MTRSLKRLLASFVVLVLASVTLVLPAAELAQTPKLPRHVLIIRHAEKPPDEANSVELAPQGKQRAKLLHLLFEMTAKRPEPLPTPHFIFAARNSKSSHRSVETVTPLAKKLDLPVSADVANEDFAVLARDILQSPKYAGKTILIAWHHGNIPELARRLKAKGVPDSWKGSVFDRVWHISYDAAGNTTFRDRPQRLLIGDSAK